MKASSGRFAREVYHPLWYRKCAAVSTTRENALRGSCRDHDPSSPSRWRYIRCGPTTTFGSPTWPSTACTTWRSTSRSRPCSTCSGVSAPGTELTGQLQINNNQDATVRPVVFVVDYQLFVSVIGHRSWVLRLRHCFPVCVRVTSCTAAVDGHCTVFLFAFLFVFVFKTSCIYAALVPTHASSSKFILLLLLSYHLGNSFSTRSFSHRVFSSFSGPVFPSLPLPGRSRRRTS